MPYTLFKSPIFRFVLPILVVATAFGLTSVLWAETESVPTHLFILAVVVSAWLGGLLPGLLATGLSSLVISFFYIEPGMLVVNIESVIQIIVFAAVASIISIVEEHRRGFQTELVETKNELEAILTGTMDGIVAYGASGKPIYANPSAAKMYGYQSVDALLETVPGDADSNYEMFDTTGQRIRQLDFPVWRALQAKHDVEEDVTLQTREGKKRIVNMRVSLLDGNSNNQPTLISMMRDMTALHEKENELRQQKRLLEVTLESIGDGVITTDANGRIEFLNPVAQELTGWDVSDATGQAVLDVFRVIHSTTEKPIQSPVQAALQTEEIVMLPPNVNLITKTGQQLPVDDSVAPIIDDEGENQGAIVVFRDTTERRRMLEELRESQQQTKRVLDNLSAYVWVLDRQGIVREVNQSATTLAQPDDMMDTPFDSLGWIPENKRQQIQTAIAAVQQQLEPRMLELEVYTVSGDALVLDLILSPLLSNDNTMTHIIVSGTDITHRFRAERNLSQANVLIDTQRRRLDNLLANVPGMIWETIEDANDLGQPVQYINSYGERLLGYSSQEWKTERHLWQRVIHRDYIEDAEKTTIEIFENEQQGHFATRCVRKDGTAFDAELYIRMSPIDQQDGKIRIYGLLMDVSELKQSRRMLADTNRRLRRSNEELKRFAYVASHDLQEPLRMVTSYLQLIERRYQDRLDQDGVEFIEFAVDGAQRMKRLINDLLQYSRVETRGEITEGVDLNEIMQTVLDDMRQTIEEAHTRITVADLPTVNGDAVQLRQLFQNLISNAVKFRRKDAVPEINITVVEERDAWRLCVADNGIGIDDKFKDRIFNIFQRLHTRDEYSGTGIGLAICHKVVEQHNGEIWFESQVDEGTQFYFTISKAHKGA